MESFYELALLLYYIAASISGILAIYYFPKYRYTPLKYIVIILWLGLIADGSGYLHSQYIGLNNHWIYNIYNPIYYSLFYLMIYQFLESRRRKKIALILFSLAYVGMIVESLYTPLRTQVLTHAYNFATIILIINVLQLAVETLRSDKVVNLKQNGLPLFIVGGYLLFEISFLVLNVMFDMRIHVFSNDFYYVLRGVQGVILVLTHSIFIFAFIWTKPKTAERFL